MALRHVDRWLGAAALLSLSCAVWGQSLPLPVDKVERAVAAAQRGQQQAQKAAEKAEKAVERAEAVNQRVDAAQGAVERAAQQANAAERAAEAAQRKGGMADSVAARADRTAAAAQERSAVAQQRGSMAGQASDRGAQASSRAGTTPEQAQRGQDRAELASNGRAHPVEKTPRGPQAEDDKKRRAKKGHGDNGGNSAAAPRGRGKERSQAAQAKPPQGHQAGRRGAQERSPAAVAATEQALADSQVQRFTQMLRLYPRDLEPTRLGPAVRAQVVGIEISPRALAAAKKAGFSVVSQETVEGLGMHFVTLRTPPGMSVDAAIARLARVAPGAEFVANHIHIQSGVSGPAPSSATLAQGAVRSAQLGIIDGGVARHPAVRAPVEHRGFAFGAPAVSGHATAVASLAIGEGRLRGAAPGSPILVADVYGRDPAGGNAMALVRALGWMVSRHVPVVAIPLAGPPNSLVAKAILKARQQGVFVVAPVGNGGPAARASYPAAYPGVVAVTGVDGRNRVLIEAGRGPRIDYAAPAADMVAASAFGGVTPVRGTSYAVPLVAGRLSAAARGNPQPLAALDREAVDLGPRGPDSVYGRGLVCARCRIRK
ncbi:MAG TPA: S8 family serine peptidase [Allosphingosinicella sp.]|nr:S8 family serine peptidase [Allosphingosinicella sp.]